MGPERLKSLVRAITIAFASSFVACGHSPLRAPVSAEVKPLSRHMMIFHAMTTPQRRALVDRLQARRPPGSASQWTVNEEALGLSLNVVDPFAGFLRRARLSTAPKRAHEGGPILPAEAARVARAFVDQNADLLGLPRRVVFGLAERVRDVEPSDHAPPHGAYVVRFDAPFASKGYEAFKELDNVADVEVFVDDDGEVSSFVNLSRVHPHLTLDTRPGIAEDDPRVLAKVIGRKVFALLDESADEMRGDVRELRRLQLGEVRADDVTRVKLVVHVSTGPQLAWLTYRLGYLVEVAKQAPPATEGEDTTGEPPPFFFFRYVVDADTGDVLEDARAPFSSSAMP